MDWENEDIPLSTECKEVMSPAAASESPATRGVRVIKSSYRQLISSCSRASLIFRKVTDPPPPLYLSVVRVKVLRKFCIGLAARKGSKFKFGWQFSKMRCFTSLPSVLGCAERAIRAQSSCASVRECIASSLSSSMASKRSDSSFGRTPRV